MADLSSRQKKAINALLTSGVKTNAAAVAGVSRRTLYNWLDQKEFLAALQAAERETEGAERQLIRARRRRLLPLLLDKLETLLESEKECVQLGTLKEGLDFWRKEKQSEIEERLEALEQRLLPQPTAAHRNGVG
jgi:AcrR family transcriptional regulator